MTTNANPPNPTTPQIICESDLEKTLDRARWLYSASKSTAMKAAAHAYVVWLHTSGELATKSLTIWRDEQIAKFNDRAKAENDKIADDKPRAMALKAGPLPANDPTNQPAKSPEDQKKIDDDKARLAERSQWTETDWKNARYVTIDAESKAADPATIVKLVFDFKHSWQASLVSRYASVLNWIHKRFASVPFVSVKAHVKAIVNAINVEGGFESALTNARNPDRETPIERYDET
jgi:hypothetical protein